MDQFIGAILVTLAIFGKPGINCFQYSGFSHKLNYFFRIRMSDRREKYEKLRSQLDEGFEWPSVYMFKFIVPADNQKLAQVENLFNTKESNVRIRQSSKGNFISVTATEMMMSPERVIDRYLEAEKIEGLIAL